MLRISRSLIIVFLIITGFYGCKKKELVSNNPAKNAVNVDPSDTPSYLLFDTWMNEDSTEYFIFNNGSANAFTRLYKEPYYNTYLNVKETEGSCRITKNSVEFNGFKIKYTLNKDILSLNAINLPGLKPNGVYHRAKWKKGIEIEWVRSINFTDLISSKSIRNDFSWPIGIGDGYIYYQKAYGNMISIYRYSLTTKLLKDSSHINRAFESLYFKSPYFYALSTMGYDSNAVFLKFKSLSQIDYLGEMKKKGWGGTISISDKSDSIYIEISDVYEANVYQGIAGNPFENFKIPFEFGVGGTFSGSRYFQSIVYYKENEFLGTLDGNLYKFEINGGKINITGNYNIRPYQRDFDRVYVDGNDVWVCRSIFTTMGFVDCELLKVNMN